MIPVRIALSRIAAVSKPNFAILRAYPNVEFVNAIKDQRKDINIGSFNDPSKLADPRYHGKAYFLNYLGSKRLQHGRPDSLPSELNTMRFEELLCAPDLPGIDTDQLEKLSMLGL